MKRALLLSIAVCLLIAGVSFADSFGTGTNQFDIEFVSISSDTNPTGGYGIVNNDYRIGKYEITNGQWDKFEAEYGTVSGSPSNAYDESPYFTGTNLPTNRVSWYEAAQFVNYLNTSSGYQMAYNFTGTQGQSDYTFTVWDTIDAGYNASNPYRNSNAFYFLPTEDEWVKAAYWNGAALQEYATKPGESLYQGNGLNGGWNYYDSGYITDPAGPWNFNSGSEELNGTFNMMGNVIEWMESPYYGGDWSSDSVRDIRGGSFGSTGNFLSSSYRFNANPYFDGGDAGFRIASVPEPTTLMLFGLGGLVLRKRRK